MTCKATFVYPVKLTPRGRRRVLHHPTHEGGGFGRRTAGASYLVGGDVVGRRRGRLGGAAVG